MSKKKKKPFGFLIILLIVLSLFLFYYWQNYSLQTMRYVLEYENFPSSFDGFKIVQISDMHGMEFGLNNRTLVKFITDMNPDIIILSGDMISSNAQDGQACLNFLTGIGDHFPIYMCLGNHEQIARWYEESSDVAYGYDAFIKQVQQSGVHILDNEEVAFERNGETISIFGLTPELYHYSRRDIEYADDSLLLQKEYIEGVLGNSSKGFNLLLAHNPSYFKEYTAWGADLILSGHMHGGIIQVPFKGGLLSPEMSSSQNTMPVCLNRINRE